MTTWNFNTFIFPHLGAKTIKLRPFKFKGMTQDVPNDLKDLIVTFVQAYSTVPDLELDLHLNPEPSFMPLNNNKSKKEAAHYF